jgi:hypothetical protein
MIKAYLVLTRNYEDQAFWRKNIWTFLLYIVSLLSQSKTGCQGHEPRELDFYLLQFLSSLMCSCREHIVPVLTPGKK